MRLQLLRGVLFEDSLKFGASVKNSLPDYAPIQVNQSHGRQGLEVAFTTKIQTTEQQRLRRKRVTVLVINYDWSNLVLINYNWLI